ncbi:hypothetical protein [Lysobacter gummosus]|uniref:hypothetical protein n=1 Tax=Lysobacter gummosus TaxID=262324 RepID=UPI003628A4FE
MLRCTSACASRCLRRPPMLFSASQRLLMRSPPRYRTLPPSAGATTSKHFREHEKRTPAEAGVLLATYRTSPVHRDAMIQVKTCLDQNVMVHLSILPTSPPALSFTRSFQVPFKASLDRFLV